MTIMLVEVVAQGKQINEVYYHYYHCHKFYHNHWPIAQMTPGSMQVDIAFPLVNDTNDTKLHAGSSTMFYFLLKQLTSIPLEIAQLTSLQSFDIHST